MTIENSLLFTIPDYTDGSQLTSRIRKKAKVTQDSATADNGFTSKELDLSEAASLEKILPRGTDIDDVLSRQRKSREVSDLCGKLDLTIDGLLLKLKTSIADYDVQVDISKKPLLKKAVRKIFKKSYNYINKEMYLEAVKRMRELQEEEVKKVIEND